MRFGQFEAILDIELGKVHKLHEKATCALLRHFELVFTFEHCNRSNNVQVRLFNNYFLSNAFPHFHARLCLHSS